VFVIIVGGGKVGTYLARALLAKTHEVVLIEKQARRAQLTADLLEGDVTMVGDGCDPLVLDAAGVKRADVVVADTGDDEDNLVVCLIAKKHSRARCIVRVNNPRNVAIFASLDRTQPITTISSTEVILSAIDAEVNAADFALLATLSDGKHELTRLEIRADSPAAGKRLKDARLPRTSIVVALERVDEELIIPSGDTLLLAGDNVIMLVKASAREDVRAALIGPQP